MTGVSPVGGAEPTPTDIPPICPPFEGDNTDGPELPQGDSSVQIAYLHSEHVSHSWHRSLMDTLAFDKSIGLNIIKSMPYGVYCSGPNSLVEGRNMAVAHFIDKTDSEWLLFVDSDMGFKPDAIQNLLLSACEDDRPIVGGLCFALKHMGSDGYGGFKVMPIPTLFMWAKNPQQGIGFANRFIYPPDALVQVAGTGTAFLLIHRSVLVDMRARYGDRWFDFVQYGDGAQVSEDLSFCYRAGELGKPIFVNTSIKITHHKQLWLGEPDYHMPPVEPMQTMMDAAKEAQERPKMNRADRRAMLRERGVAS